MDLVDLVEIRTAMDSGYCNPKWRSIIDRLISEVYKMQPELLVGMGLPESEIKDWFQYFMNRTTENRNILVEFYAVRIPALINSMLFRGLLIETSMISRADYESVAYITLIDCVKRFNGTGNFWGFARQRIRWRIIDYIRKNQPTGIEITNEPIRSVDIMVHLDVLYELCHDLPINKRIFLIMLYMGMSIAEIARDLNISVPEAKQWAIEMSKNNDYFKQC